MVCTVVLAAGRGSRFGAPKQFALLQGVPLVGHAVRTALDASDAVVVVLPPATAWEGPTVHAAVVGGPTRAASVRSGVAALPAEATVVIVHDAAHPLASRVLFEAAMRRVKAGAIAAVPVLPVTETLARLASDGLTATLPRATSIVAVQAPQVFQADVLRSLLAGEAGARDEISLFLQHGYPVSTVPGDPLNVHVTTPADLEVAARLVAR